MSETEQTAAHVPETPAGDRRVRKTRAALYRALVAQILAKGYEEVTIQDVLDAADVGRSTFYSHFAGKEALLRFGFDQLRAELDGVMASAGDHPLAFSLPLLRHARDHAPLYRAMVGERGVTVAQLQVRTLVSDLVRRGLKRQVLPPGLSADLAIAALAGAYLGLLQHWIETRLRQPPEAIDRAFRSIAEPLIATSPLLPPTEHLPRA